MKFEVLADANSVALRAASLIAEEARVAVAARGRFVMAVSGGHTPWLMLGALAGEEVPWKAMHVVQVDERVAPPGDPDRNLTHLRESLLEHAPLRPEQIYAMPVESADLEAAAAQLCPDSSGDCGLAAGARPCPPGSWPRRPHGFASAGRSGAQSHRRRCGADRSLPREAPHDLDVPHPESFPKYPLACDRK